MKSYQAVVFLLLLLMKISDKAFAERDEIQTNEAFNSPDLKFTAQLMDSGNIRIKTDQTGEVDESVAVLTPLFALRWTGDSKTIVTIEHIAGGTQAALIHLSQNKWHRFEVEPPDDSPCSYSVVKQEIGFSSVKITYKVEDQKDNGEAIGFYTYTFDIDPGTDTITNVVKRKITIDAYRNLTGEWESKSR